MVDEELSARLEERRANFLGRLGVLSEQIVSRLHPLGGSPWPASPLGRMRIVRRARSRLLVTDGLSCPYDPDFHADAPDVPLDYELCIDVPDFDPGGADDDALAQSWFAVLLYSLTDWLVPAALDVRGVLGQYRAITLAAPATTPDACKLAGSDGNVGLLVGLPLVGSNLDLHPYLNGYYEGSGQPYADASLGYFPLKVLTLDEFEWAKANGDEGGVLLAEKFLARRDAHLNWTGRPSVLLNPKLS